MKKVFFVMVDKPIPDVRATVWVFYHEEEAEEFGSCLYAFFDLADLGITVTQGQAGQPQEVFPSWSF